MTTMLLSTRSKFILLLLLTLASLCLGLFVGPVTLSIPSLAALFEPTRSIDATLLFEVRLPRLINGFTVGSALGLAGLLMQVLLSNPLADPYILGISSGASFAVLLALLLGASVLHVPLYATLGASVASCLVYQLAKTRSPAPRSLHLLLTGILIACAFGALIQFMLVLFPERHLPGALFWLLGDLPQLPIAWLNVIALSISFFLALMLAVRLNLLSRGPLQAAVLGLHTARLHTQLFILAAVLTATAVSLAGNIGFIGLMMPHAMRLIFGCDHRLLLPSVALSSGSLFICADVCSRTLFLPYQMPVGIFMTLLGVPWFLYLMRRVQGN